MIDDIFDKLYPDEWKEEEYNTGFIATKFEPKKNYKWQYFKYW